MSQFFKSLVVTLLISSPALGATFNCRDQAGPVSEFCQKDMYFKCEQKNAFFKAVLHFKTHGPNDSMNFGYGDNIIYLGEGYLGYESKLWVTDSQDDKFVVSKKGSWEKLDYNFTLYKDWESTGEILKKGTNYLMYPEENPYVPTTLRGHIPNKNGSHKAGKTFTLGGGDKKYGDWHNLFTFYAVPERNIYKLFWVIGSNYSDIQVYSVNCSQAKKL